MALSIQTNMASVSIQNQLGRTNSSLATSLERLGSGLRINSAKDDAAGLQIANRLNAQVRGQEAALYNVNNANSMLQTAEGALDEMTNIALRMKELATQAADGSNSADESTSLDKEYQDLVLELNNILENTSYGAGTKLLTNGKFADEMTFQIGASTAETLKVDVSDDLNAISMIVSGGKGQVPDMEAVQVQDKNPDGSLKTDSNGDPVMVDKKDADGNVVMKQKTDANGDPVTKEGDVDATIGKLSTSGDAQKAMTQVDDLINAIGTARSSFGASMNRLEHTAANLSNMKENTEASAGQIMDADFAKETASMTKQQLLMNSGISVLSTANSTTQMIGSLLR